MAYVSAWSASTSSAATEHGTGPLLQSTAGAATEHNAQGVSYPPADATEHGSSATITEDLLQVVIPFLTMKPAGLTMCGPTDVITGEHVHVWCDRCANFETPCAVTHNACPDCRILRTIMQLSRHWEEFTWDYHVDMKCMFEG